MFVKFCCLTKYSEKEQDFKNLQNLAHTIYPTVQPIPSWKGLTRSCLVLVTGTE